MFPCGVDSRYADSFWMMVSSRWACGGRSSVLGSWGGRWAANADEAPETWKGGGGRGQASATAASAYRSSRGGVPAPSCTLASSGPGRWASRRRRRAPSCSRKPSRLGLRAHVQGDVEASPVDVCYPPGWLDSMSKDHVAAVARGHQPVSCWSSQGCLM